MSALRRSSSKSSDGGCRGGSLSPEKPRLKVDYVSMQFNDYSVKYTMASRGFG